MDYKVFATMEELAQGASDLIEAEVAQSTDLALGLAGGSTPAMTYKELAGRKIDWSATTAWMTDERWVEPTDPHSNQLMARRELIDPTGIRFLAPDTRHASPESAAEAYALDLRTVISPDVRSLTILGIGTDGHTASLFPQSDALGVVGATYVANYAPAAEAWRLTATFDLLAKSDVVLFLVVGAEKADMVAAIASSADVPAARVTATDRVLWLLEKEAASSL